MDKSCLNESLTEKYRPKTFDEIVGNRENVMTFQRFAAKPKGTVPNILLIGPAGYGKTTAVRCFVRERKLWLGNRSIISIKDSFDGWFEEYNASSDRGLDFVRSLSRSTRLVGETIIYLNEADYMTKEAQAGLRSIIENKGFAIFILDGNNEADFIEPIKSRCVIFRFKPLTAMEILQRLLAILKDEKVQVNEQVENIARKLAEQSNGDMRRAINDLETYLK